MKHFYNIKYPGSNSFIHTVKISLFTYKMGLLPTIFQTPTFVKTTPH